MASVPNVGFEARSIVAPAPGWLFSPLYDVLFVSVAWWALLAVFVGYLGAEHVVTGKLTLVNLLLLNLPHRWFTLVLVFLDRERYAARPAAFNGVLVGLVAATGLVYGLTGSFAVHGFVVALMTKWHFAAQHHGILRVYARLAGRDQSEDQVWTEKWMLRGILMYALMRVIGTGDADAGLALPQGFASVFWWTDFVAIGAIALLVWREVQSGVGVRQVGRMVYLSSALAAYGGMILAAHFGITGVTYALGFAVTVFHAVEYMGICGWSMGGKKNPTGVWAWIVPRSGLVILAFMVILFLNSLLGPEVPDAMWLFVNVVVTLAHFAYDGIIWKRPAARPALAT